MSTCSSSVRRRSRSRTRRGAQLEALSHDVTRQTGNHVGMSELGEDELPRLAAERPPVVADLERDSVTLAGADAGRLFQLDDAIE